MFNPDQIVEKAKHSRWYLKILNWSVSRVVPFNKPHGFRILEISDNHIKTFIPYKKQNLNHIRGLHACALATISELTTGFLLVTKLGKKYRLIMQRLEMDYHYQGKTDAFATFSISEQWLNENLFTPLKSQDSVVITCVVTIHDNNNNHLTTGKIFWQLKDWSKVKTKVS